MKIGFFTDGYLPQLNGVATSVVEWSKGLEKLGHKVYIIAPSYPDYKDKKNVIRFTSFRFIKQPEIRLAVYFPGRSMLKVSTMNFDIIHGVSGGTVTNLGLIMAKLKKVPFVFTYYTRFNHYAHYFLKGKIIRPEMIERAGRIFCNRCDCIIAPMPKIKDELISFGVKRPITVIPSGVNVDKFRKQRKGYLRKKTGIKSGKILLYVGRLGKEKSVDFLLKAFKVICEKDPTVSLVLIGDGPEKENLEKLSEKLNISKRVYFTGLISAEEISKVYADAEIFIFASTTETQGMVILEALASSLPIVAVNDRVFDGIIQNKKNGILVKRDYKKFAQECLTILKNPSYRKSLSDYALKSVRETSTKKTAKAFEKLYENLIAQSKKR